MYKKLTREEGEEKQKYIRDVGMDGWKKWIKKRKRKNGNMGDIGGNMEKRNKWIDEKEIQTIPTKPILPTKIIL